MCSCPLWNEQRLEERAIQLLEREPNRRLFQPERVEHVQPETRPATPSSRRTSVSSQDPADVDSWFDNVSTGTTPMAGSSTAGLPMLPRVREPGRAEPAFQRALTDPVLARRSRIAQIMNRLNNTHACAHNKWHFIPGRHQCEECHYVLKQYIFQCKRCQLQACNRCRRNRL